MVEHAYEAAQTAEGERRARKAAEDPSISETVFSHTCKVELLADASVLGYLVHLHVILVPVDLTVQRVAERVRRCGHAVPESKIREWYDRLWGHIAATIKVADVTEAFDNSSPRTPSRICVTYAYGTAVGVPDWPRWAPRHSSAGATGNMAGVVGVGCCTHVCAHAVTTVGLS